MVDAEKVVANTEIHCVYCILHAANTQIDSSWGFNDNQVSKERHIILITIAICFACLNGDGKQEYRLEDDM